QAVSGEGDHAAAQGTMPVVERDLCECVAVRLRRHALLDTVARVNGDQFGVILVSEQTAGKIAEVAEQLRKAIRAPFNFGDRDLALTSSLGITIFDNSAATAEQVLHDAELAMYYAKRQGGDRIEAYRAA